MNKQFDIPAPLEPGQPVRWNEDGTVRYFNPPWHAAPSHNLNVEYFDAIREGIISDEAHMDADKVSSILTSFDQQRLTNSQRVFTPLSKKEKATSIQSYWRSTGKRFRATHNSTAAAKRKAEQISNRRRGRKRQVRDFWALDSTGLTVLD